MENGGALNTRCCLSILPILRCYKIAPVFKNGFRSWADVNPSRPHDGRDWELVQQNCFLLSATVSASCLSGHPLNRSDWVSPWGICPLHHLKGQTKGPPLSSWWRFRDIVLSLRGECSCSCTPLGPSKFYCHVRSLNICQIYPPHASTCVSHQSLLVFPYS